MISARLTPKDFRCATEDGVINRAIRLISGVALLDVPLRGILPE